MGRPWRVFAFAVAGFFASAVAAQGPTEVEVRALLDSADRAIAAKDIDALATTLSEDVQISGAMSAENVLVDRFRFDKPRYLAALRDNWTQATDYTYRRTNQRIVVSGAVATVTADVFESATVAGGVLRTQTRETTTVERRSGAVVVTRIEAEVTVSGAPR